MSGTVEDVIAVEGAELGNTNGAKYFNYFGVPDLGDWCMAFQLYGVYAGGASLDWPPADHPDRTFVVPDEHDCPPWVFVDKDHGRRGDLVLYDWDDDSYGDHIGMCLGVYDWGVSAREGNTGNPRAVRDQQRVWSCILGFMRPNYGSKPQWKHGKGGWWYDHGDGTYATGWEEITDKDGVKRWYCFDDDGWMLTGFVQHADKDTGEKNWYYLSEWTEGYAAPEGHMVCGGIYTPKEGVNAGEPFAFYKDGRMVESGVVEAYPWQKHDNHFGRLMT